MMRKLIVTLVAAIIGGAVAYAGSSTVNYTSSGTAPFRTTTDGTANNLANVTIWDSVAGANGLTVNANGQLTSITAGPGPGATGNNIMSVIPWTGGSNAQNGTLTMASATTTAPTTYTNGNSFPLSLDLNGSLRVNCTIGCAGSGGTAIADKAAWTVSTTQFTLTGGEFTTGGATACTTGQACTVAMTADRSMFANLSDVGGTPLTAAVSAYGTPPTGTAVMGVNAFITNASTPVGPTTAQQSPVLAGTQNSSNAIQLTGGASAATTTIITGVAGKNVYVTAWDVIVGGTGIAATTTFQLSYGTGTNCATGQTTLTGAYPLVTGSAGISKGDGSAPVLIAPVAGASICATYVGTSTNYQGSITYQQF